MSSPPTAPSESSTLRSRSNRPSPLEHTDSSNKDDQPPASGKESDPKSANYSNAQFPGGLYLPAVKGTIGGIESPRRHVRNSGSISTIRDDSSSVPNSASIIQSFQKPEEREKAPAPPPASKAIFRSDPTIRSCITGLKMDRADEIARLFGVA